MPPLVDYSAMLRVWPAAQGRFAGAPHIPEDELYCFFEQRILHFSKQMWLAGLQALLRNGLLYKSSTGNFSFIPGNEPRAFEPMLEPAWRQLWQDVRARLTFPLGCLWSTGWLKPVLPPHRPVLVMEVNWSERRTAMQSVALHAQYVPVDGLTAPNLQAVTNTQSLVVVRSLQRPSPVRVINAIPTARLEKIVVDLPVIFPQLVASAAEWLLQVRQHYQLDDRILHKYSELQEKQRASEAGL